MKVVSGTIIQYGDKVLMCKRAEKQAYGGEWSIPLGKVNTNESPINGAKREFFEDRLYEMGCLKDFRDHHQMLFHLVLSIYTYPSRSLFRLTSS